MLLSPTDHQLLASSVIIIPLALFMLFSVWCLSSPPKKAVEWWTMWTMWTMWTVVFMTGRSTVTHSWLANFTHHCSTGVSTPWSPSSLMLMKVLQMQHLGYKGRWNAGQYLDINEWNMNDIYSSLFIYGQCTVALSSWSEGVETSGIAAKSELLESWILGCHGREVTPKRKQKEWVNDDFCWWGGLSFFGMRFWCIIMICFSLLVADHFWNVCTTLM